MNRKQGLIIFLLMIVAIVVFIKFISIGNQEETAASEPMIEGTEVANRIEKKEKNEVPERETETVVLNEDEKTMVESKVKKKSLDKKTIAFFGDSLIEGYGNENKAFDYYLSQDLRKTNFLNNSKSGSTITENSGEGNIVMINQVKTLNGNPDIIIFDGGANDIMGYALGFLNNDLKKEIGKVDSSTDVVSNGDTVITDLEKIIKATKDKFPNAKICYFQPFLLDDDTIGHLTAETEKQAEIKQRRDEFYGQIEAVCQKWNIAYVDVSDKFKGTGTNYRQDDWIHIKEAGYQLLTPLLKEALLKLI